MNDYIYFRPSLCLLKTAGAFPPCSARNMIWSDQILQFDQNIRLSFDSVLRNIKTHVCKKNKKNKITTQFTWSLKGKS